MKEALIKELESIEVFLLRSIDCLAEEDSGFKPTENMLTVAQQVAHIAQTVDWFVDGATKPEGFDMDFEKHWVQVKPCSSLNEATDWFKRSIAGAKEAIGNMDMVELMSPLPAGPVMGGAPKLAIVGGISDHTAHHRGALTVYSRLLGKTPKMPYMD